MNEYKYWQRRFLQLKAKQLKNTEVYERALQPELNGLYREIQQELNQWYVRYANNEGLTLDQARKVLANIKTKHWQLTLKDFEAKAKQGGFDQELDREYYRSRIARLQLLETQLQNLTKQFADQQTDSLNNELQKQFEDTYMRTIYTNQLAHGQLSANFATFNEDQLRLIVAKPWGNDGKDFSARIWKNYREELPNQLMNVMLKGTLLGYSPARLARELQQSFTDVKRNNIHRLIISELGHIAEEATAKAYEESNIEKYEYMATLESHTCTICGHLDGEVFKLNERKPGINYPVIHARCRCTTVPYLEDLPPIEQRWMRDSETGKGKLIKNISFDEWKKSYGRKAKAWYNNSMEKEQEFDAFRSTGRINDSYINSKEFVAQFNKYQLQGKVRDSVVSEAREILKERNGTHFETISLINAESGRVRRFTTSRLERAIDNYTGNKVAAYIKSSTDRFIMIHNHPDSTPPSLGDIRQLTSGKRKRVNLALVVGHDGRLFSYTKSAITIPFDVTMDGIVGEYVKLGYNKRRALDLALKDLSISYNFEIGGIDND
ncbi:minor capsid protein [Agrilactobacillus fermenti]|uniref:minor capsid protein n=1 Tax=Agrilactobacillus fermenti TaxID=2586909 RepID=UPI003A5C29D9